LKLAGVTKHGFSDYLRPDRRDLDQHASSVSADEEFRRGYYAFTSLAYSPQAGRLFCGTTNFGNDLLHSYDPASGGFASAGYGRIAERYEIKIHRSLALGGDGWLYGATSCLHGVKELAKGLGGKVFRYCPATGEYDVIAVPIPQLYIQTISLDWRRGMIYGMAYPVFEFFALDIARREVVYRQYMGSISHIGAVDPEGGYWGTWLSGTSKHNLFRYDPAANEVKFFDHGFPTPCRNLMYYLAGPIDSTACTENGGIYLGHESGELYRLDWRTGEVEYLCKPLPGTRLPALALGPDGLILGVGGSDDCVLTFAYDSRSGRGHILGPVGEGGMSCYRAHDCCLVGDSLFVGETDNPKRSCYLWECRLA